MSKCYGIRTALSPGEEAFALHCRAEGLLPNREYRFHPTREWRFDFAFVGRMIAVEIEGGSGTYGRHQRPGGFEADAVKYNAAAKLGWRVFRYTTRMVTDGTAINDMLEVLR